LDVKYQHDKKLCTVWLTNTEKHDSALRESLHPLFIKNKAKGYLTAVLESGGQNLYDSVRDLLSYNKIRIAELEQKHTSDSDDRI